ncbi:MAG: hydroxyacid dehydrogenase, partial [Caldilineaceae bacterium]|nr:hydroxyacid dehydrogenase [Caldilineaceae bacterium]
MADRPKVILAPYYRTLDEIFTPIDLERLHACAEIVWARDEPLLQDEFDRHKADASAVVTTGWRYGPIDGMPKLRAIMEVGGRHPSPEALDYAACFARGVRVLSCAPAFGPMVAEMALGMTLALARQIVVCDNDFRRGEEIYLRPGNAGAFSLYGQTVGLIGFGGLARALLPLLAPFGCKIQVFDPWLPDAYLIRQRVTPVALDTLLATSKVIYVLAIPSIENRGLLDRTYLELIPPDALFMLISRAHL